MTKDEALKLALEALHYGKANKAVTILREALEQPVQEPVACRFCHDKKGSWAWQCYKCGEIDDVQQPAAQPEQQAEPCIGKDPRCPCQDGDACHYKDCGGTKAWPVPQAEPVACRFCHSKKGCYTWLCYSCGEIDDVQQPTPPAAQRPWVGLTEDEKFEIAAAQYGWEDLLIAAEAKLKERNT